MNYYEPRDFPQIGSRLSMDWQRPTVGMDFDRGIMEQVPRGRTQIIIEGESEFVERIEAVIQPVIAEIKSEIET